jgi:hypothetical protein
MCLLPCLLPVPCNLTLYRTAFSVFVITYGTAAALSFGLGVLDLSWIPRNFIPLTTAAIIFSSILAVAVYAASFLPNRLLSQHGNSGIFVYDFWMGRELNPRAFKTLDMKEFCELYPGMIGWGLLNLAFAYQQYQQLGKVTNAMLLVNAFELWYVGDGLWNEAAILTTMDITTDGFGFMLAFGDLAWVPFTFCTQVGMMQACARCFHVSVLCISAGKYRALKQQLHSISGATPVTYCTEVGAVMLLCCA